MTGNSPLPKAQRLAPLLVIAAGLLAYHNSFTGAFVFDDFGSIPDNPTIRHLWPIWQCLSPPHRGGLTVESRPLINLSLAVNYALGGLHVWGYHAFNLTIHILAGLSLLGIVRRTLLQPRLRDRFGAAASELAMVTAILWTVHPLQTEAVTYIIQRAESLMGFFYLLTLYCFIRGAESSRARLWYSLCVGACALGMASKEVMVSTPVMVILYDRAFLSASFREAWRRRLSLYIALASTWILLGILLAQGQVSNTSTNAQLIGLTWWRYLATEPGVILYYLRLFVWPSALCLDYGWGIASTWVSIVPSAVVVVILLGLSAWAWRKNSVWGFMGAWFFLILAPSSSFIPLHSPIYEHRMYLSSAMVASVVVMGLYSLVGRQSLWVLIVAAIALGVLTWRRNQDYRSPLAIWTDTAVKRPNNSHAYYNLGTALVLAGRFEDSLGQYEKALRIDPNYAEAHNGIGIALERMGKINEAIEHYEQSLRINPDFPDAHYSLGNALREKGQAKEAIEQYEQALKIRPDYAEAHYNLGIALWEEGRIEDAVRHYEQALRFKPDLAEARYSLGIALARLGWVPQAVEQFEWALRIRPNYAEAHYNLGVALAGLGRVPEAIQHWEQALRIKPDYAEAHGNWGVALERSGRAQEAIGHYEEALRLKPRYAEAHYNLGVILDRSGNIQEAIAHYEQALRIKPDYAEAHNNLGIALARLGRMTEAIGHWEEALRINPNYARAHYNLATALEATGRASEAIGHYEQALRINPQMAEAQNRLARLRAVQ